MDNTHINEANLYSSNADNQHIPRGDALAPIQPNASFE